MVKTKRNKLAVWTASVCAFGMVMGLVACAPQATEDATEQKADENKTVQQVYDTQADVEEKQYLLATGQLDNPASLMIASSKSELAVSLLVQLRNRALDAYSELTRISL